MGQSQSYIISDNIVSTLGWTTDENYQNVKSNRIGLCLHKANDQVPFDHFSGIIDEQIINTGFKFLGEKKLYTKLEKLCIGSISDAIRDVGVDLFTDRTQLIISTTKGNIDLLLDSKNKFIDSDRVYLDSFAQKVAGYFKFKNQPIVISNACISGVVGMITADRLIRMGACDHVIVCGADLVSPFTLTGFNSLKALSAEHCKPFDQDRAGINLGEAAATVLVSNRKNKNIPIKISGGSISNDANHISGPSRTGSGMQSVIHKTIKSNKKNIDLISAHGTATLYNDDMEAYALDGQGLSHVPVHSLKGYYGHTLGAAGVIESIIGYRSVLDNCLIKSVGMDNLGTATRIQVIQENAFVELNNCLKTSSGFGGCNAAILFSQIIES